MSKLVFNRDGLLEVLLFAKSNQCEIVFSKDSFVSISASAQGHSVKAYAEGCNPSIDGELTAWCNSRKLSGYDFVSKHSPSEPWVVQFINEPCMGVEVVARLRTAQFELKPTAFPHLPL
jgi:hypothetical protein